MARAKANETAAPIEPEAEVNDGTVLVETTGNFALLDLFTGAEIGHDGPTRVPNSAFVMDRIEAGQLQLVE